MKRRKRPSNKSVLPYASEDLINMQPKVRSLILKILVPLGRHRELINELGYRSDDIASLFSLPKDNPFEMEVDGGFDEKMAQKILHRTFFNEKDDYLPYPQPLANNVAKLANLIGLTNIDAELLCLAVLIQNSRLLIEACDFLGNNLNPLDLVHILAVLLDTKESEIKEALNGRLTETGILDIFPECFHCSFTNVFTVFSRTFADHLLTDESNDPLFWLKDLVTPSPDPILSLKDYEKLSDEIEVMIEYLKEAINHNKKGVNILLWGDPGVGKSELSRVIAKAVGCDLLEISNQDFKKNPISGEQRLCAMRAANAFFCNASSIFLMEESSDIFSNGGGYFGGSIADSRKSWVNRFLEESNLPTIYTTNDVDIDHAFLRRFDFILNIAQPDKNARAKILRNNLGSLLDEKTIVEMAKCEALSPAIINRSASIVNSMEGKLPEEKLRSTVTKLMNNTLIAQGYQRGLNLGNGAEALPSFYHTDFIETENDNLQEIAEGIKRHPHARILLHGIAGSGKSAWARYISDYLNKPLVVKRISDLISPYYGVSEKNIRQAFDEAESTDSFLLIDECDSFLQSRSNSSRNFEQCIVNEMLTSMEMFNGVFMASTNMLDVLDLAVLRRFDLKIKFNPLRPASAWKLFLLYCESFGIDAPEYLKHEFNAIDTLTAGDFACIGRRDKFKKIKNAEEFISALIAECDIKSPFGNKKMGFV
ncbi:MAG: ATP-binding protein [Methylococcales bacterium]|jgi:AAA+ superfamily predicted ATPase|nr:ATP-binding protein [Methylococcales bacterium]